ncbi:MAG TPA: metallophosphoesterase [Devosia sp.]|nr:metallophosphoesterase [Devosia sp.]
MTSRPRLAFHTWPAAVYAIGDVHGCVQQLRDLEAEIVGDAADIEGEKWLVTLGDHVDRGPASRGCLEHVMGPTPAGFRRFALLGNHEQMMLDFLDNPYAHAYWLEEGGAETLATYGLSVPPDAHLPRDIVHQLAAAIPPEHVALLRALPVCLSLPGWLFVHAGIRPGIPLGMQTDDDLVWIRAPFLTSQLTGGLRVVHGHTPGREIVSTPHRIDIDTWCFHTGRLSAVRVTPDGRTRFLSVQGPAAS